jgi:amino acid transporter
MSYHSRKLLLVFLILLLLLPIVQASISSNFTKTFNESTQVRINTSTSFYSYPATDWILWIISGFLGLVLFLISLRTPGSKSGIEINTVISVLAWIPIAFCGYASFAVDRLSAYGVTSQNGEYVLLENHIVYSFPVIGIVMFVFLVVAIVNTLRLLALNKLLSGGEGNYNNDE